MWYVNICIICIASICMNMNESVYEYKYVWKRTHRKYWETSNSTWKLNLIPHIEVFRGARQTRRAYSSKKKSNHSNHSNSRNLPQWNLPEICVSLASLPESNFRISGFLRPVPESRVKARQFDKKDRDYVHIKCIYLVQEFTHTIYTYIYMYLHIYIYSIFLYEDVAAKSSLLLFRRIKSRSSECLRQKFYAKLRVEMILMRITRCRASHRVSRLAKVGFHWLCCFLSLCK